MHLVWYDDHIVVKPLPLYLLDPGFWGRHILGAQDADDMDIMHDKLRGSLARRQKVAECARGILFLYTALIAYKSDFCLAQDLHLLPDDIRWEDWQSLTSEFLKQQKQKPFRGGSGNDYASHHPRYWYGELRLSRLDKVYIFTGIDILRGYSRVAGYSFYRSLLSARFKALATLLGYVLLVLMALQVGLGVDGLADNRHFQRLSYALTLFSILAPLGAGLCIVLGVLPVFVSNFVATKRNVQRRLQIIGVQPGRESPNMS